MTFLADNLIENGNQIRLYYHMEYLGTADYLTSPMTGKVESWTHYNEWGEITHNAVLKCGQRELDLVKRYATHDYDSVLSMYYAKARFYDAGDRRFASIDPILDGSVYDITDYATDPVQRVHYLYVRNNPVVYIDPDGLRPVIDDLDPYEAYSEKSFDYRYYRQEHKDMFIEGIVSSATAPVYGFDLSQAKDYQKKIPKCKNNLIYYEGTDKDKVIELQTRYRNAKSRLEKAAVIADMAKYTWSLRYNNARNYYIIGTGGNPSAGEAFDISMGYLIGSQVSYAVGQSIKGSSNLIKGTVETRADNIATGPKLNSKLTYEEASSVFTKSGTLQPEVVKNSSAIISGSELNNPSVINALTKNGSNINDWAKMTTQTFKSPSGDFQVHFYQNLKTWAVSTYEMKVKFIK